MLPRSVAAFLVLIFAVIVSHPADGQSRPATLRSTSQFDQRWLDSVVSIERQPTAGEAVPIGTGFVVLSAQNHLLLVTAKHVILDRQGRQHTDLVYRLNRASGSSSQLLKDADLVASRGDWFVSPDQDVAVRFLPVVEGALVKAIPLDRFVEEKQVEAGTPLAVLGFPMGLRSTEHARPIARRGMVARAEATTVIADVLVFPGNSGGPVLYVPAFKSGGISFGGAEVVPHEMLVGVIVSFIPYRDVAVSQQTNRPRIVFEENSGLATAVPAWVVKDFVTTGAVASFDKQVGSGR
jgi:hypothetical protein